MRYETIWDRSTDMAAVAVAAAVQKGQDVLGRVGKAWRITGRAVLSGAGDISRSDGRFHFQIELFNMNIWLMTIHYYLIYCHSGFFRKNRHMKSQRSLAYPCNPQLQCCDRKCRASSTEMVVFLMAAKHKIQKTILNWGTGGHDLCGVVLHWMAVFWRTRYNAK